MAQSLARPAIWCAVALAAWMSSGAGLRAQSPDDPCAAKASDTPEARTAACSVRIESPNEVPASRAEAFAQRGNAHYQRKEWDQAIADLDAAITLAPDTAAFHSARGRAHRPKRDFDRARLDPWSPLPRLARWRDIWRSR